MGSAMKFLFILLIGSLNTPVWSANNEPDPDLFDSKNTSVATVTTTTTTLTSATVANTTTTTPAPTTTKPPVKVYNWVLKENNFTCIHIEAGIEVSFNSTSDVPIEISVPVFENATVSGSCNYSGAGDQVMKLEWDDQWSLEFWFDNHKPNSEKTYELSQVCATDGTNPRECVNVTDIYAAKADSYQCTAKEVLTTSDLRYKITMENVRLQAFMENTKDFGGARICRADQSVTNEIVPIIVGACLAALVVIVLIAYLIGRARAKRSTGYESV